jgi:hypothetical protein
LAGVISLIKEDHRNDGLIAAMIGELRHHVEEDEEDIFPKFVEAASNELLSELGEKFTAPRRREAH